MANWGTVVADKWEDSGTTLTKAVDTTGATGLIAALIWSDPTPASIIMSSPQFHGAGMTLIPGDSVLPATSNTAGGDPGQRGTAYYIANPDQGNFNFTITSNTAMGNGTNCAYILIPIIGMDTVTPTGHVYKVDAISNFSSMSQNAVCSVGDLVFGMAILHTNTAATTFTHSGSATDLARITCAEAADSLFVGIVATSTSQAIGVSYLPNNSYNGFFITFVVKAAATTTSGISGKSFVRKFMALFSM